MSICYPLSLQTSSMASLPSPLQPSPSALTRTHAKIPPPPANPEPKSPSHSSSSQQQITKRTSAAKLSERGDKKSAATDFAKERKEEVNRKIASKKAISVIMRREATKAVIEKKSGPKGSKQLLPRTVLEALHERIKALRWESALKVFELLREQLWYRPNYGVYIKLMVMLGKCKKPEKAHELFQAMADEGCLMNCETYTALLSAYSRSGFLEKAFLLLEHMKNTPNCQPDVFTYSILIKSCLQVFAFDKVQTLLSDMAAQRIKPNTVTYNTLIDAYGKAKKYPLKMFCILNAPSGCRECGGVGSRGALEFSLVYLVARKMEKKRRGRPWVNVMDIRPRLEEGFQIHRFADMESILMTMLQEGNCKPDVWTMNSTLRAFGSSGQIETMEKCYDKFQGAGIEPNIRTFNILLDSYGKSGNYEKMSAVMEYMQKYHFSWTLVTYNVVIDAFGRAGDLKQMEYLFRLMRSERIKPNCVTLCSLVSAYGQADNAEKIGGVLRLIENSDVTLDIVFFNCLVDAYGKLGRFAEMKGVLELMEGKGCKPDVITYRTMIKAYSKNGMAKHAKELLEFVREQRKLCQKRESPTSHEKIINTGHKTSLQSPVNL